MLILFSVVLAVKLFSLLLVDLSQTHANLQRKHSPSPEDGSFKTLRQLLHSSPRNSIRSESDLSIFITTFNAGGRKSAEPCSSHNQSSQHSMCHWFNFDKDNVPDLVVVGIQEMVPLNVRNFIASNFKEAEEEWLQKLGATFQIIDKKYEKLLDVKLLGLYLVVYHRSNLNIKKKFKHSVATGINTGVTQIGNKGGVGISIEIGELYKICFINSHLAAGKGEENNKARNSDAKRIQTELKFNGVPVDNHDVVFWMGDLNYRLSNEMQAKRSEVTQRCSEVIASRDCLDLLEHDQLTQQLKKVKDVFCGFKEEKITFRPTYKYNRGTGEWDTSAKLRTPAWCDRILHKSLDHLVVELAKDSYTSVESIISSDHKPVRATFKVKKQ